MEYLEIEARGSEGEESTATSEKEGGETEEDFIDKLINNTHVDYDHTPLNRVHENSLPQYMKKCSTFILQRLLKEDCAMQAKAKRKHLMYEKRKAKKGKKRKL